jgi:hypothetical protein
MRPVYESAKDRKAERFFMFLFPEYVKVPKAYGFDFLYQSDVGEIYINELKVRSYSKDQVPDGRLILSYNKVLEMQRFPAAGKRITFLLTDGMYTVSVDDCVRTDVNNDFPRLTFAGRTDRNDWQDREPCVQYDVSKLRRIKSKEEIVEAWKIFEEKEKTL